VTFFCGKLPKMATLRVKLLFFLGGFDPLQPLQGLPPFSQQYGRGLANGLFLFSSWKLKLMFLR